MANTNTSTSDARPATPAASSASMAMLAPIIGWLIPGAGHLIQRRWIRGLVLMACVVTMFGLGLAMDGKIYKPNTGDLLDMLGFVGDVGAGGLYILGRMFDWGRDAITYATADYGTKFIVVAGLLNVMCVVDAYHIAIGKKP
jgi:hypothetical protein